MTARAHFAMLTALGRDFSTRGTAKGKDWTGEVSRQGVIE